jgi:TonB family protein
MYKVNIARVRIAIGLCCLLCVSAVFAQDTEPVLLPGNRTPEYPKMSLRLGEAGRVTVQVKILKDGTAGAVEVASSSGFPRLDSVAVNAVRQWKFKPATKNGVPVEKIMELQIGFRNPISDSYNSDLSIVPKERQKLVEERRILGRDKGERERYRGNPPLNLEVTHSEPSADGSVIFNIKTNTDTASLKINGLEEGGSVDGNYVVKKVARVGQATQFTITAVDINGNSDAKTITLFRKMHSNPDKATDGLDSDTSDSKRLNLQVTHSKPDADGAVFISVYANADVASLTINGVEEGGRSSGSYRIRKVARVGQDTQFTIVAIDINGNSDTKTITVSRQSVVATQAVTAALKPETIKRAPGRDAVAIIIGIQNYKRVPRADFASNDAKEFYEYAVRALGVKPEKIKMLLDDEADEINVVKAFENWLPIQVNRDKTDVYVFFSGHGLPAPDGKSLYFLPHGVDKELLSRTAVAQNEVIAALAAAKPRSVTMFIDACYSGQTRAGDVLMANAKPVTLKSDATIYPPNFTVITASANDQISSSSPELKHGIFSLYLMKGMEGEADANQDGKITVGEMQDYLSDKVSRQAMTLNRKQYPQLVGDAGRVLVGR